MNDDVYSADMVFTAPVSVVTDGSCTSVLSRCSVNEVSRVLALDDNPGDSVMDGKTTGD